MSRLKYFFKNLKSKKRLKIFGQYAKGIIYESENGIIALPIQDLTIGKKLGFKGQWDIKEVNQIKNKCSQDDNIYVIGTHVGTLLVPLAKSVRHIFGFEANKNTFWYAQKNLCLNDIKNVNLFNYAIGDKKKEVTFYQSKVNTGGSKIKPIKASKQYTYDNPETVTVQMIALDSYIVDNKLPQPSGIIMDIEGSEYFALKGMQNALSKTKFLYIEYVPHHLKNVSNVSLKEFMDLIIPHFTSAYFIKKDKRFSLKDDSSAFWSYLDELQTNDQAEDILFENSKF